MTYENINTFKDLGIPSDASSDEDDVFWSKRLTFYQIGMEILPEKSPAVMIDPSDIIFKNKFGRQNNPFLARNSNIEIPRRHTLMPGIEMNRLMK